MTSLRIVFMGTPDFAVPTLKRLIADGEEICGVFTQPDKPQGRKMILQAPPVKEAAIEAGIKVWQPEKMRDESVLATLKELDPELIVVVAYGKILPKDVLELPKYGCINVHGSLLPKYRGAAPIQWSVLNGDKVTGITTMQMDVGLDTGDILLMREVEIDENETSGELYDRMALVGADLCSETLAALKEGKLNPVKQNDADSSYASMLSRDLSEIDWTKSAAEIHNKVRGLQPWPVACTTLNGKRMKIHSTRLCGKTSGNAGAVVNTKPLTVACGDGNGLIVNEVQLDGSKKMRSEDFLRGRPIEKNTVLGE